MRQAEKALAAQAETSHKRSIADWGNQPQDQEGERERDTAARIDSQGPRRAKSRGRLTSSRTPALRHVIGSRPPQQPNATSRRRQPLDEPHHAQSRITSGTTEPTRGSKPPTQPTPATYLGPKLICKFRQTVAAPPLIFIGRPLRKRRPLRGWCPHSGRSSSAGVSRPTQPQLAPPQPGLRWVAEAQASSVPAKHECDHASNDNQALPTAGIRASWAVCSTTQPGEWRSR